DRRAGGPGRPISQAGPRLEPNSWQCAWSDRAIGLDEPELPSRELATRFTDSVSRGPWSSAYPLRPVRLPPRDADGARFGSGSPIESAVFKFRNAAGAPS